MATHTNNNIVSQISANNTLYDIHDKAAIHTLADLAALGFDVEGAFIFKGTVATVSDLPSTGNQVGYVYHVASTGTEYVWVKTKDSDGDKEVDAHQWEEFGHHFLVEHTHSTSPTTVSFTPNLSKSDVYLKATTSHSLTTSKGDAITALGTATTANAITGITTAKATVVGSVTATTTSIPAISEITNEDVVVTVEPTSTANAITALGSTTTVNAFTTITPTTGSVIGSITTAAATFATGVTTSNKDVVSSVTATSIAKAITGFGTHTTAKAITSLSTTTAGAVSIKGVKSVGSASSWKFEVKNEVLEITGSNGSAPTTVSLTASKIGDNGNGTYATGSASGTANAITALGTATTANAVTEITTAKTTVVGSVTATTSSAKVVTTFTTKNPIISLTTAKTAVITGFGAHTTAKAITGIGTSTASVIGAITTVSQSVASGVTTSNSSVVNTVTASSTAKAITGFGAHTTAGFLKSVSGTPSVSLTTTNASATGYVKVGEIASGANTSITIPAMETGNPQ